MTKIVDVRFRSAGKSYRFDANDLPLKRGDHVIVDNQKGKAFAYVLNMPHDLLSEPAKPLRKVLRIATAEDEDKHHQNLELEKRAYHACKEKVAELGLDMKLVAAEQAFVGKKMTFYFTADDRVDFRELVKALAAEFHTRIEMRQIGVRDETTMCGGIGVCGRELCCCTYLTEFAPVSIKMAKAQNLSLNPGKISGTCGRLMCCLRNEAEAYEELNKTVPKMGEKVGTPEGAEGTVTSLDVLRQRVKVLIQIDDDNKEMREYAASELTFKPRGQKNGQQNAQKKDEQKKEDMRKKDSAPAEEKEAAPEAPAKEEKQAVKTADNDAEKDKSDAGQQGKSRRRRRSRGRGRRKSDRPSEAKGEKNNKNDRQKSGGRNQG